MAGAEGDGPLSGLKVLELGQLIAGPFCGQLLADFGAEVVKVEPPGAGDAMRQWGRADADGRTAWWSVIARGKKSVTIDLRSGEGQALARDLAARADVLVENFRPGTLERWGLSFESLSAANPGLVMTRVSGYGQTGPYASRAGFASVCEAMGGLRHITGDPDRPPARTGLSIGDSLAGANAMIGTLMALRERERTGRGQVVDVSLLESVLWMTEALVSEYDALGFVRNRTGSILPGIAPSNAYPTADGREVVIGANQDAVFRRLAEAMEMPALAGDPRYATHRARADNQAALDREIAAWTRALPAPEIVERLAAKGVPAGLAYTAPDMLADPHFAAREAIVRVEDERFGPLAMQNVFPRLSETPGHVRHAGPALGAHTEEVLSAWLDMGPEAVAGLRGRGVV